MIENMMQSGVNFVTIAHDRNCPTISTWDMHDCTCREVGSFIHKDENQYLRDLNNATQMNREARRAAERAVRKATAKTKAARATGAASKGASTVKRNCSTSKNKGGAA